MDNNKMSRFKFPDWLDAVLSFVAIVVMAIVIVCLTGCKATQPNEIVKTEYIDRYIDRLKVDSIYRHDSIYIKEKNDTIYEYREIELYRNRYLHDTIHVAITDTITNYEVKEVEKKLTRWQSVKMEAGGYAISLLALVICFGVGYVVKKFI